MHSHAPLTGRHLIEPEGLAALRLAIEDPGLSEVRFRSNLALDGLTAWEEQGWLEHLESERSLTGDHVCVVVRRHHGVAMRGFELFRNKAGCGACHAPPMYTDNAFHDIGIGYDKPEPDPGRGKISKNEKENGAFKTPTMRSLSRAEWRRSPRCC